MSSLSSRSFILGPLMSRDWTAPLFQELHFRYSSKMGNLFISLMVRRSFARHKKEGNWMIHHTRRGTSTSSEQATNGSSRHSQGNRHPTVALDASLWLGIAR